MNRKLNRAMKRTTLAVALWAAMLVATPAQAGRNCEARPPSAVSVQRGMDLATRMAAALDASGAQVVVLARAGQDLSKYQLRWSHLGFAYREGAQWRVLHKLNQCGTARAELYRQGLGEFFLDDPAEYVAAVAVFNTDVQAKLLPVLRDNTQAARLHHSTYSMVAYPWAQTYQQSNQWVVETLAMSQEPSATSRPRAQAWMQFKGYQPTTLRITAMTRLGARMTAGNVAFDDHPNERRFSDRIDTVTADSVFDWLQRSGLAQAPQVVR
jgi:hypothetical protein